jgi:branched-chain amino acid aminotransferase
VPTASTNLRPTHDLAVWVNGTRYDDPSQATVAATDHGLVVGDGVFEATRITPAGAFALSRHLDRLSRSADALDLPAPDHNLVREGVAAVLEGRTYELGKLRITYTGGVGPLGSQAAYGPTTLVVAAEPIEPASPTGSLVTTPWRRNEHGALTGVKSTSYAENVRGLAYAATMGATEALFLNTAGYVCEGTGTNLFCVFGERVITPSLASGPLAGITRGLLLEWAAAAGSPIEERDLTLPEALAADEVFLTSALRDLQAVTRWDAVAFGSHRPVTRRLAALFAECSGANVDP